MKLKIVYVNLFNFFSSDTRRYFEIILMNYTK